MNQTPSPSVTMYSACREPFCVRQIGMTPSIHQIKDSDGFLHLENVDRDNLAKYQIAIEEHNRVYGDLIFKVVYAIAPYIKNNEVHSLDTDTHFSLWVKPTGVVCDTTKFFDILNQISK